MNESNDYPQEWDAEKAESEALDKMMELFLDEELTVNDYKVTAGDVLEHIAGTEELDLQMIEYTLLMARGVDCGRDYMNFIISSTESFIEGLVDDWMRENNPEPDDDGGDW